MGSNKLVFPTECAKQEVKAEMIDSKKRAKSMLSKGDRDEKHSRFSRFIIS